MKSESVSRGQLPAVNHQLADVWQIRKVSGQQLVMFTVDVLCKFYNTCLCFHWVKFNDK